MTLSFGGGAGVLTIPGLTSDSHNGVVVAGAVAVGDAAAALVPTESMINGQLVVNGTPGNDVDSDDLLLVTQFSDLTGDSGAMTARFVRGGALNGHVYSFPILRVLDLSENVGPIAEFRSNGTGGGNAQVGHEGGLGLFSKTPPTAPRTLAQATITAITDANAKAAVQACANALSDMGVLTLT